MAVRPYRILISVYRNGGEYIRPPFVHKAFKPRSRPKGVYGPILRSKISP